MIYVGKVIKLFAMEQRVSFVTRMVNQFQYPGKESPAPHRTTEGINTKVCLRVKVRS